MRKVLIIVTLLLALGLTLFPIEGRAQRGYGYGMGTEGYGEWNYCPYCGKPLGPGTIGPGYGRGPGMMHRDWGRYPQYQQPREPLDEKSVKEVLENYLKSTRNPNLKLGKVEDKESYFEAEILTKDDSLADKVAVDKTTGRMRSIY